MDTTTLPPPAFSPFTDDGRLRHRRRRRRPRPGRRHRRARTGHLRGPGARGDDVPVGGELAPRAHHQPARRGGPARPRASRRRPRKYATPWDQMGDTLFTTSLAGEEIVRLQTWGTGDRRSGDYLQGSPCTMLDIPQPLMEPLLIKNAAERGRDRSASTPSTSATSRTPTASPCRSATVRTGQRVHPAGPLPARRFDGARSTDRRADRPAVRGRARPGRHRLHPASTPT